MWSLKRGIKQILKIPEHQGKRCLWSLDERPNVTDPLRCHVRGWALDLDGNEVQLSLRLDGREIASFKPERSRLDVHQCFPESPYSLTAGFDIVILQELFCRIQKGRLSLTARFAQSEEEVWTWEGAPEEHIREARQLFALQYKDSSEDDWWASFEEIASFYRTGAALEDYPASVEQSLFLGKKLSVHLLLRTTCGGDLLQRRLLELNRHLNEATSNLEFKSTTVLVKNPSALEQVKSQVKERWMFRSHTPKVLFEQDFPRWRNFLCEDANSDSALVLHIDETASIRYSNLRRLCTDFAKFPAVRLLMGTPYGFESGVTGPLGAHISLIQNNEEPPELFPVKFVSPLWVSSLHFLRFVEPDYLGEQRFLTESIQPRNWDRFSYHFDLRQPVLSEIEQPLACTAAEKFYMQRSLSERYSISFGNSPDIALFVVPCDDARKHGEFAKLEARAVQLADLFRKAGKGVVFITESSAQPAYIHGYSAIPFGELPPLSNLGKNGFVFAVGNQAVPVASVLAQFYECRFVRIYSTTRASEYDEQRREWFEREQWANKSLSFPLPIDSSPNSEPCISKDVLDQTADGNSLFQKLISEYSNWHAARDQELSDRKPVSVIVPVFNSLDSVRMCLRGLFDNLDSTDEVIVVNDASDKMTSAWLREILQECKQGTLVERLVNGGFIEACYSGLEAAQPGNDLLLLNSDTVLPEGGLERLKNAAYSSSFVGAISPLSTGSPHFQLDLNPGDSLRDANERLDTIHQPRFPISITPEGQCLYLKRWAIERFGFLDRIYERGFCEESDLCMRFITNGVRTSCADNLLIHHRRSASFSSKARSELIKRNRPVFDGRWEHLYLKCYEEFRRRDFMPRLRRNYALTTPRVRLPLGPVELMDMERKIEEQKPLAPKTPYQGKKALLRDTEVVFILSSIIKGGGALSVLQHVNELLQRGVKAAVVSLQDEEITEFPLLCRPIVISVDDLFQLDWSNQRVVATYWFTAYVVQELTQRFPNLKGYYYIQDYEPWFYPRPLRFRTVQNVERSYELGLTGVAKTYFLKDMVEKRHGANVQVISPGIARDVFYPGTQDEYHGRPRLSALLRPRTPRRGSEELLQLVTALRRRLPELEIHFFGTEDELPEDIADHVIMHGFLSQDQVGKLYRQSDIVVDLSHWQGFGRMGIEGMACGAVPVLSQSGGVERYASHQENSLLVDLRNPEGITDSVVRLAKDRAFRLKLRRVGLESIGRFGENEATSDWMKIWEMPVSNRILMAQPHISQLMSDHLSSQDITQAEPPSKVIPLSERKLAASE